jgi:hypothetical protein
MKNRFVSVVLTLMFIVASCERVEKRVDIKIGNGLTVDREHDVVSINLKEGDIPNADDIVSLFEKLPVSQKLVSYVFPEGTRKFTGRINIIQDGIEIRLVVQSGKIVERKSKPANQPK